MTCGSIFLSIFNQYNVSFGSSYVVGRVEISANDVSATVCRDTVNPDYFAQQACKRYSSKFSLMEAVCYMFQVTLSFHMILFTLSLILV